MVKDQSCEDQTIALCTIYAKLQDTTFVCYSPKTKVWSQEKKSDNITRTHDRRGVKRRVMNTETMSRTIRCAVRDYSTTETP
jgi:hypothetical protein